MKELNGQKFLKLNKTILISAIFRLETITSNKKTKKKEVSLA